MEEFSALAARVAASVVELRGCLILSRDGLVLGAFPEGQENLVKPAWLKFAVLGEPEKGFVEFGDEIWTYVRRGPYAAFAVSGLGIRPGLLMDQLDQTLYAAEELRVRREALRVPDAAPAPSSRPRTSLHPDARPTSPPASTEPQVPAAARAAAPEEAVAGIETWPPPREPVRGDEASSADSTSSEPTSSDSTPFEPDSRDGDRTPPEPAGDERSVPGAEPVAPPPAPRPQVKDDGTEVDRVALAQELSRLLQETQAGDENQ